MALVVDTTVAMNVNIVVVAAAAVGHAGAAVPVVAMVVVATTVAMVDMETQVAMEEVGWLVHAPEKSETPPNAESPMTHDCAAYVLQQ